jgi:hypothetical protein
MIFLRFIIFIITLALTLAWHAFLEPSGFPALPLGAIMMLPLIYYKWPDAILFCLLISLVWESPTPLPFGSVALPLMVACVFLQLVARHQLRTNILTRIFGAVLLESVVTIAVGLKSPPVTVAGAALQMSQTIGRLLAAAILCPLWLWVIEKFAREKFEINLEGTIKDL